jgi:hypothetical protein
MINEIFGYLIFCFILDGDCSMGKILMNLRSTINFFWITISVIFSPLLLSACKENIKSTPVETTKFEQKISNEDIRFIEKYIKEANQSLSFGEPSNTKNKRELVFDKSSRTISFNFIRLDVDGLSNQEKYIKKYDQHFMKDAIQADCEGTDSRTLAKIKNKNNISFKYVEKDKTGKEFFSWTITPNKDC